MKKGTNKMGPVVFRLVTKKNLIYAAVIVVTTYAVFLSSNIYTSKEHPRSSKVIPNQILSSAKNNHEDNVVKLVKDIGKNGHTVLVSVINYAFLPFAHSWLCNTLYMGIHSQVLFIVPDARSRDELKRKWADIHVVEIGISGALTGSRNYTTAGYIRIQLYRAKVFNTLLSAEVDAFLFEVDAVWFRNPVDDFKAKLGNGDIGCVRVMGFRRLYSIGIIYLRATNRTRALWAELTRQMTRLVDKLGMVHDDKMVSEGENDQTYYSNLLNAHYHNVTLVLVSEALYPDGKWYSTKNRDEHPVLINNNWIIGKYNKIQRAIKYDHWFWNMTSQQCDTKLVRKIINPTW